MSGRNKDFLVGKALAMSPDGGAESDEVSSRVGWRRALALVLVLVFVAAAVYLVVFLVGSLRGGGDVSDGYSLVPKVEIVDEGRKGVSDRTREWVAKLERELGEYGVRVTRAVVPAGLVREIDIYVADDDVVAWYFKMNVDRSPAVSAEDAVRVLRYVRDKKVAVSNYVDLRVERRAYYK